MNTSAPASSSSAVPATSRRGSCARASACEPGRGRRGRGGSRRCWSQPTISRDALREQDVRARDARRADAGDDDAHVLGALADDPQRVQQRREHDDRRAVLVVVEDGDVELVAQPPLDLEAARRRDVLEVDAAERRARSP